MTTLPLAAQSSCCQHAADNGDSTVTERSLCLVGDLLNIVVEKKNKILQTHYIKVYAAYFLNSAVDCDIVVVFNALLKMRWKLSEREIIICVKIINVTLISNYIFNNASLLKAGWISLIN